MRRLGDAAYRVLLSLFPRHVRRQRGDEMAHHFAHQRRSLRGRPFALASLWIRAVLDAFVHGLGGRTVSFHGLGDDVRLGFRLARKNPGSSLVTILILSLGVGVTCAMLSLAHAIFFKPWPFTEPERVAFVYRPLPLGRMSGAPLASSDAGRDAAARNEAVAEVAGFSQFFPRIEIDGVTISRGGELVTTNFFDLLGVRPVIGRTFYSDEDSEADTEFPVVISDHFWRTAFAARPDIVGQPMTIRSRKFTVIGVLGPEFHGVSSIYERRDWWAPSKSLGGTGLAGSVIRLRPGATVEDASLRFASYGAHLNNEARAQRSGMDLPDAAKQIEVLAANDVRTPMAPTEVLIPTQMLTALGGVVAMVLLVAVMNVAGLGLSRSLDRAAEISTRRVLGVSTGRLIRQLMTEQLVLAVIGGALGAVLAVNLVSLTNAVLPDRYLLDPVLDWRMTGVAFALAVGLGALVSLAPVRHALRATIVASVSTASLTTSPGLNRAGRWFLVPQVVLSVLLLVLAGVHARSLAALELAARGYSVDGRIVADVVTDLGFMEGPEGLAVEERDEVVQRLAARVRDWAPTPIGFISQLPLGESGFPLRASSDHAVAAGAGERLVFNSRAVSEGAFDALGITLVRGQTFGLTDRVSTIVDTPAIVSEHFAQALWPNEDPVGRRFQQASSGRPEVLSWFRVIGVAADTHSVLPSANPVPVIYKPLSANLLLQLVIAGYPNPDQVRRLTDDLMKVSPTINIANVRWMEQVVDTMLAPRRIAASLLAASGLAGLLLACTGLYGQTALAVARRRREFGIRLALGASPRRLISQVVREHTWIAVAGSVLGLAGAAGALRISVVVVRGVPTTDIVTFAAVPVILAVVTLAACFLPARRAALIDPARTLRE